MDHSKHTPVTLIHRKDTEANPTDEVLPSGKLRMVITYLEMRQPKHFERESSRNENLSIIRAHNPHTGFYRYLYNAVGKDWLWYERNELSDTELEKIIHHPDVRVYVLYLNGTPAGYGELDFRIVDEVEIAYFGLIPEYIGRGLGSYFLRHLVETAWNESPNRVWVHTCNFDSPNAISVYQITGFSPYRQETKIIEDPRLAVHD